MILSAKRSQVEQSRCLHKWLRWMAVIGWGTGVGWRAFWIVRIAVCVHTSRAPNGLPARAHRPHTDNLHCPRGHACTSSRTISSAFPPLSILTLFLPSKATVSPPTAPQMSHFSPPLGSSSRSRFHQSAVPINFSALPPPSSSSPQSRPV